MSSVAELAQRPHKFMMLSFISIFGEEFFYRGVFLLGGLSFGLAEFDANKENFSGTLTTVAYFLTIQAMLYGLNHIAFGLPAVTRKMVLGLFFGILAIFGGLLPPMIAHLFYQFLVIRQFRSRGSG